MLALLALRRPLTEPEMDVFDVLFPAVYAAYVDDVWRTLARWHVGGEDLEDYSQETFLRFIESFVHERPPDVILAKLRGLAMGLAMNRNTREKRSPISETVIQSSRRAPGSAPRLDLCIDLKEVARRLYGALSPEHQAVIKAVVFDDMTREEAGLALRLPKSTVISRVEAALEQLRKLAPTLLTESQRALV
jgi:DNA-directed RNA polymerase specialized sigma24 family protein